MSTVTGFAVAVEIGDWSRFTDTSIGSSLGWVPGEYSSGRSRGLGPITTTGNGHVRRLLVEAAWHHQARYRVGQTLRDRWDLASPAARAYGDAGNRRLHARWTGFQARTKDHNVATVAITRQVTSTRPKPLAKATRRDATEHPARPRPATST